MAQDLRVTSKSEIGEGQNVTGKETTAPVISVIIPTFHRPNGALNAVGSVLAQIGAPPFEIILVDNDAEKSAEPAAKVLSEAANQHKSGPVPFTYAVEPAAGVANARNTAVALACGTFIAFLDDDEVATPDWLANLMKAQAETGAEVVFGPIEARVPANHRVPSDYFKAFFSRLLNGPTRLIEIPYGCGNCLLHRDKVLSGTQPFNPKANETGGEDDILWREVVSKGYRFGWAADAWVYEDVPPHRATWHYLTQRAFAFGHNATGQWYNRADRNYLRMVLAMAKGVVQAVILAPLVALLWLTGHAKLAWAYDKMWRGIGKVFWFGPFRVGFYGAAARRKGLVQTHNNQA
ncbi:UDP-Glc:alpha-D-GlcNAc-diphosphoundecaprenol beta-1,3-glucosyltransferase WfgD [Candidatus Phycosocius bacilliformis]|uniref:UDP-Glc:alpha-D-GlcNAc-diphosphoundecaprenol beta-1,3-glucosyltransferase WfgD n=1 Tax=Candidatus Phycosocius bacilliformis TaxID=1445552 RepID=A0A2P2E697_9PROT|nr:UDP-Glc:alpha-D-GlcNAc-diphosphoundecaprenol beta-1,3-glucosyltransferase WfgD [Candidatus Phycosocius bacilliformis]